jgi:integrase
LPENLRLVVKVSDLAPAIPRDYEINGKKSRVTVQQRLRKHILPFFGAMSASELGTDDFDRYVDLRRKAGAKNATINREMAALKRIFRLARHGNPPKLRDLPVFPARLKESAPRQGFVEDQKYAVLMRHAEEPWLRALVSTAYAFAFRKSELLIEMKVKQVDLETRSLTLYAGTTKNDEGRVIKMTEEVCELVRICVTGKSPDDHVFTAPTVSRCVIFEAHGGRFARRLGWGHSLKKRAAKVASERSGRNSCSTIYGVGGAEPRNMVRYGVGEGVVMKIGGRKTRSMFGRYNIVSEADIREVAGKIEEGRRQNAANRACQVPPTQMEAPKLMRRRQAK